MEKEQLILGGREGAELSDRGKESVEARGYYP